MERLAARQKIWEEHKLKLPPEHILKTNAAFTKYRENNNNIINNKYLNEIEGSAQYDKEWSKVEEQQTLEEGI